MVAPFRQIINRLVAHLRPASATPPAVPESPCPLAQPDAVLPTWVADDPVVQKYRALLGDLPWGQFPERPADRPYPGPTPQPRVSFAAAYLVKLQEDKRFMSDLRTYLIEHPALVYWLGFARVPDPTAPHGFDVAASVPTRRQLSTVLRHLPNPALQFLLSASIDLLKATLPTNQQATFGDIIAGDTQAILAWVKENNPKQFITEGRLDKTRQPAGDPDCKLGVKKRRNAATEDATGHDHPAPTSDAKPASKMQVGVDILWGYASGIVVTRLPDGTEVVLAERTRPFNEDDITHFFPLMAQVEARTPTWADSLAAPGHDSLRPTAKAAPMRPVAARRPRPPTSAYPPPRRPPPRSAPHASPETVRTCGFPGHPSPYVQRYPDSLTLCLAHPSLRGVGCC